MLMEIAVSLLVSNITTTINSVQTKGNIITFDVSSANAITIVINGFIGNNGVII